jgi:glycerol-1-phosphate dehydrogenase [NAD(P)+]
MRLPRDILIGPGVLGSVSDVCKDLGFLSSVLILTGPHTHGIAGKKATNMLEENGFSVSGLIVEKPEMKYVNKARKVIQGFKPEVVLGVGGGKVIDVAKLASSFEGVPFISVPTAASHDGVSSSRASIKDLGSPTSMSVQAPIAIIADTDIIARSPYRLIASGCGDIVAKYTAVRDWRLAHKLKGQYYGEYAASLALMSAKLILRNAAVIRNNVEEGVRVVLEALISCGVAMSIAGSSKPCSGAEHLFSHALDMIAPKPALHGEQCGVGTIMMAYLHRINWRMIREKLRKIGSPTTADELGIEPRYIVEALTTAHKIRPERYTILGESGLSKESAERLARVTGVID